MVSLQRKLCKYPVICRGMLVYLSHVSGPVYAVLFKWIPDLGSVDWSSALWAAAPCSCSLDRRRASIKSTQTLTWHLDFPRTAQTRSSSLDITHAARYVIFFDTLQVKGRSSTMCSTYTGHRPDLKTHTKCVCLGLAKWGRCVKWPDSHSNKPISSEETTKISLKDLRDRILQFYTLGMDGGSQPDATVNGCVSQQELAFIF